MYIVVKNQSDIGLSIRFMLLGKDELNVRFCKKLTSVT